MYVSIYIYIYIKIRSTKRFVFFEFIYFALTYVLYICMFPACCFHQRTYVAQGLVNGVLNETCFQFEWPLVRQAGLYRDHSPSFLECIYFGLLLPLFDIWYVYSCVCVMGRVFTNGLGDLGSIPGRVIPKTLKMVLDTSLLNSQQYKVCIKGKVRQSREKSSALPGTPV